MNDALALIRRYWFAIAVVLALLGVGVVVTENEDGSTTVAITVDGPDRDRKPDDAKIVLPPAAQEVRQDAGGEVGPAHGENQRDETPPDSPLAAPGDELREAPPGSEAREAYAESILAVERGTPDEIPADKEPLATGRDAHCATRLVRSYSSRYGAPVGAIALHYTAGSNIMSSLADMNGLTAYSNSNQVSWHRLLDHDGNCYLNVPLDAKAWTIAGLNPFTINYEMIGTGRESTYYGTPAGLAKLVAVARADATRYGIPLRRGAVSNCRVTRTGFITHWMGGFCSGGHVDIRPHDIDKVIDLVRRGAFPSAPPLAEKRCRQHVKYTRIYVKLRKRAKEQGSLEEYGTRKLAQVIDLRKKTTYYFTKNHDRGTTNYDCQSDGKVTVRRV